MVLTISTNEALNENIGWLVGCGMLTDQFVGNLRSLVDAETVTLEFNDLRPKSSNWDGKMCIKFATEPTAMFVINYVVSWSGADEFSMDDEKTLRLWWN